VCVCVCVCVCSHWFVQVGLQHDMDLRVAFTSDPLGSAYASSLSK
jgi:predicted anti-sigma-YlaC factor YlaD